MKKNLLNAIVLCYALLLTSNFCSAQTFSHGNLTITFRSYPWHDSTHCVVKDTLSYTITKQNSFTGDSVKLINLNFGTVQYAAVNSTGQNPWIISNLMPGTTYIDDFGNIGYPVHITWGPYKVISGTDTVYNAQSDTMFINPNPCVYDTISGRIYFDNNNNCVYDAGDSAGTFGVDIREFASYSAGYFGYGLNTYTDGHYGPAHVQISWLNSYTVSLPSNYQFIFPPSGCSPVSYTFTTLPQGHVDFALQCSNNLDVQCFAASPVTVRPLIPFTLATVVNNTGCTTASGTLTLVLDPRVTYNAGLSTNPATTVNGNTLSWNYANLTNLTNNGYWNSFIAGVYLTPNNTISAGDSLCFTVTATVPVNDINPANNTYNFCVPVVNSFDPNAKEVSPKGTGAQGNIPASTPELTYTVHFQNTGNANAIYITVLDTLDSNVQPASLRIISTDHTMSPEWKSSNIVAFHFDNVNLPDTGHNLAASTGFVTFKVALDAALAVGTQIKNRAAIYFDNNPAVYTNTTLNTIVAGTGITALQITNSGFQIYPNPASNDVNVVVSEDLIGSMLTVTDITGRRINSALLSAADNELSTESLANGIYFLSIRNENALLTQKLVVQR